jgi:hypothetical protein
MTTPDMHVYIATVETGATRAPVANRIEAAYYKVESTFTTFKDCGHKDVYTVRNDLLASVEKVQDGDSVVTQIQRLLAEAEENGSAQASITAVRTVDPDGGVYTGGYDVHVSTLGDKSYPGK